MDIDPLYSPDDDCSCNSDMTVFGNAGNSSRHQDISEWTNLRLIGAHGVYELYTATRYGRKYFIKGLGKDYRLPEWQRLLFKEFELGIQLDHPYIARTVSWETVPELGEALVSEYVDGLELGKWLKSEIGKDRKERLKIARQIAEALNYLHSSGVSHRDLKPDNILVTRNGKRVKIIDFGLGDSDAFIVYKHSAGTRAFGAPEQMPGQCSEASMSADIYSFGKIIRLMFPGRRYNSLIRKCLRKDASARPSASEVLKSLNRNHTNRIFILGLSFLVGLAAIGLLYFSEQSRQESIEEIKPQAIRVDTVYVHKNDTVMVETPAKPSDSAIKAVWDKAIKDIDPQIKFYATYDFPDHEDHSADFESIIKQWQDHIYYSFLEIGCTEATAQAKRKELETYMRHRAREFKKAEPTRFTDSIITL